MRGRAVITAVACKTDQGKGAPNRRGAFEVNLAMVLLLLARLVLGWVDETQDRIAIRVGRLTAHHRHS